MSIELILIDDDSVVNMINKRLIKLVLPNLAIESFTTSRRALSYLEKTDFERSIILLDINIPDISGWEFMDSLSTINSKSKLQILLLSSSVDHDDKFKSQKHPLVEDYLEKPLTKVMIERIAENYSL